MEERENIGKVNRQAEHYKVVWVVVKDRGLLA